MDFATLPPEVNSGLMYTGPGSGPMIAAAASWDGLATEVSSAAGDYGSVISGLTSGPWRGPASASMAAAAAPYVSWMNATAAQAEQAADQAKAAASAYEAAFTATVAPPVIAANRTLLASLVATNILGQNTPAIATTEAHYAEMWAQDAAAMYGYAGSSRRLWVGDLRPRQRSVARPGLGVDGGRRRTIHVMDECHRRASRTGRRSGKSGGQCLRSRVHRDGSAAGHRGQPRVVGIIDRHQHARPEHPRDRDDRSPLRRDVGPRRRRDVRLRRILGSRIRIDAVPRTAGDHHVRPGNWDGNISAAVAAGDFGPRSTARARLARAIDVVGIRTSGAFGFTDREFDIHERPLGAV